MSVKNLPKHDSCDACPIAKVTELVGDAWSLLIIRDLISGPKRFGDLIASLTDISSRTLTKKLQFLETKELIERKAYQEKPPRVEYKLTSKGKALNKVLDSMRKYGETYL